jgi:hypothetical protein
MDIPVVLILILIVYSFQRRKWLRILEEQSRYRRTEFIRNYLDVLLLIHFLLFIVYYIYTLSSRSDSQAYYWYTKAVDNWFYWWGSDTRFIQFITWPFSNFLGLSYESTMLIFCYLGFQGVVLFYLAAKENINYLPAWLGSYTAAEFVFLLPNVHFWSSSIGKGGVMLTGIGLIIFGLSRFQKRYWMIVLGAWMVYMIRGHILFIIILGAGAGLFFTLKGIKWYYKLFMIVTALTIGYLILDDLTKYTGRNDLNIFESEKLQHRVTQNTSATSGVDIGNYNQAQKLFTFWFRPLFIDAPGFLGVIVSFENLVYLLFAFQVLQFGLPNWKNWNGWFRIGLFIFLFGSVALAQIAGNLGIAMRQKAQIMPLFFIIYCKAISYKANRKRI